MVTTVTGRVGPDVGRMAVDWFSGVLAVVCLAVALLHLARLAVHAVSPAGVPGGPLGESAHAVMALGMAAMFAPVADPLPGPVWTVVFVLTGGWFAVVAVRTRSFGGDSAHHVVGAATMLFMLAVGHGNWQDHAGHDAATAAGHAAHGGGADAGLGPASAVAIVLAGYFAWHVLRCADQLRPAPPAADHPDARHPNARHPNACSGAAVAPQPADPPSAAEPGARRPVAATATRGPDLLRSDRAVGVAHMVMAVAMTVMLLAMI